MTTMNDAERSGFEAVYGTIKPEDRATGDDQAIYELERIAFQAGAAWQRVQVAVPHPLRYTNDGELAECPCCGSVDVGGAHDTVNCYGCGLQITKPRPLQNAVDAWNKRALLAAAPSTPAAQVRCEFHGDDSSACEKYSGNVPCEPSPARQAQPAAKPMCPACNDNGLIGGPSFYAPDEGGVPCPECNPPASPAQSEVQRLREALDHIIGLSRALRVGGPDPMDLEGLSNALEEAVDTAHAALAASTGQEAS